MGGGLNFQSCQSIELLHINHRSKPSSAAALWPMQSAHHTQWICSTHQPSWGRCELNRSFCYTLYSFAPRTAISSHAVKIYIDSSVKQSAPLAWAVNASCTFIENKDGEREVGSRNIISQTPICLFESAFNFWSSLSVGGSLWILLCWRAHLSSASSHGTRLRLVLGVSFSCFTLAMKGWSSFFFFRKVRLPWH